MAADDILPRDEDLVLPPNEEILPSAQDLTNATPLGSIIDTSTLGQFNGGASQADIDLINRQVDPLAGETPAIINATNELFVPTLNQPILKGTSSSQTLGNQPIFVPGGGNIPFAAFERQKQARQAQALKQAEDANKFKLRKAPLTKDPRLNRNLNETFNEFTDIFIKRAEEQFGDRVKGIAALTNPTTKIGREFIQQMDNLDILASQADQIVDEVAKIDAAIESGDQFVSKESEELSNRIKQNLSSGDIFAVTSLRGDIDKLQTSQTLDQFFKDNNTLKNIEGEITKRTGISDFGDFKLLTERERKEFDTGVREAAKAIKSNVSFRNRDLTEDDIFKRIKALKGRTDEITKRLKTKPQTKGFKSKEDVPVSNQQKIINVGNTQFRTLTSVPFAAVSQKTPLNIDGLIVVGEDGGLTTKQGISKFTPVESDIIEVQVGDKVIRRNVVRGKETIIVSDLTDEEKRELGIVKGLDEPKTIQRDVTVDFDNIKAALKGASKSSSLSAEAFEDVSRESVRNKTVIDDNNFDAEFNEAFIGSGFTNVDDFIQAATESGIDIVFSEGSKKKVEELRDPLNRQ